MAVTVSPQLLFQPTKQQVLLLNKSKQVDSFFIATAAGQQYADIQDFSCAVCSSLLTSARTWAPRTAAWEFGRTTVWRSLPTIKAGRLD